MHYGGIITISDKTLAHHTLRLNVQPVLTTQSPEDENSGSCPQSPIHSRYNVGIAFQTLFPLGIYTFIQQGLINYLSIQSNLSSKLYQCLRTRAVGQNVCSLILASDLTTLTLSSCTSLKGKKKKKSLLWSSIENISRSSFSSELRTEKALKKCQLSLADDGAYQFYSGLPPLNILEPGVKLPRKNFFSASLNGKRENKSIIRKYLSSNGRSLKTNKKVIER